MRKPGTRLHRLAAYLCDAQAMERLIGPTISDMQVEFDDVVQHRRKWASVRIWVAGHIALLRVIAVHSVLNGFEVLRDLDDQDRRAVRHTIAATAVTVIAGTMVLTGIPFMNFVPPGHPSVGELAFYLIPQGLPLAIPIGITAGILWSLGRYSASGRTRFAVFLMALGASGLSFVTLAWLAPNSNQAFREAVMGQPLAKGENELTLPELYRALDPVNRPQIPIAWPVSFRSLGLKFHSVWALASAPAVLAVLALSVTKRRRWGRVMPVLFTGSVVFIYYTIMSSAKRIELDGAIWPFAAAWAPNVAVLLLSLFVSQLTVGGLARHER